MNNMDVLLIVATGGIVGGGLMRLAWRVGFMQGERSVSELWLKAIDTEAEINAAHGVQEPTCCTCEMRHDSNEPTDLALAKVACRCGGLCPACAVKKK